MTLLSSARELALRIGLHVQRADAMTMSERRLARMIANHGVRTVLDVGANSGGYASDLLRGGYEGSIISFEPIPDAWSALSSRAAATSSRWKIAPRMALSNIEGDTVFHLAGNSASSSLLPMLKTHSDAAPESKGVGDIIVDARRLDDVLAGLDATPPLFLKIDVQGAEMMVLGGALETLRNKTVGVQVELSIQELYAGQALNLEVEQFIRSHGFECWELIPGFRDPASYRMLQYDAVFFKPA